MRCEIPARSPSSSPSKRGVVAHASGSGGQPRHERMEHCTHKSISTAHRRHTAPLALDPCRVRVQLQGCQTDRPMSPRVCFYLLLAKVCSRAGARCLSSPHAQLDWDRGTGRAQPQVQVVGGARMQVKSSASRAVSRTVAEDKMAPCAVQQRSSRRRRRLRFKLTRASWRFVLQSSTVCTK